MALNPLDLIMLDNVAATGAGPAIGFATELRYGVIGGAAKPNQNQFPKKMKILTTITDSATGGSATVQFQDSPDGSAWTTRYTRTYTVPAAAPFSQGWRFLFSTQKRYVRANVSVLAGGVAPKVNAYATVGTFGA